MTYADYSVHNHEHVWLQRLEIDTMEDKEEGGNTRTTINLNKKKETTTMPPRRQDSLQVGK